MRVLASLGWVDSVCADCPGFLVPGVAGPPPPKLQIRGSATPSSPTTRAKNGTHTHKFLQHKGAHTDSRKSS